MNDTVVTVVGNVATRPEYRQTASGAGVVRFRLAATARRWDRARESWVDGSTSFYTVWAWRALAENLAASVTIGEPLLVHGKLRVREEWRDGRAPTGGGGRAPTGGAGAEHGEVEASRAGAGERAGGASDRDGPHGTGGGDGRGRPGEREGRGGGEGVRWVSAEIDAVAVGHDLARGTAAFRRVSQAKPQLIGATAP